MYRKHSVNVDFVAERDEALFSTLEFATFSIWIQLHKHKLEQEQDGDT